MIFLFHLNFYPEKNAENDHSIDIHTETGA